MSGKFPYPGKCLYPGFLHEFLHSFVPGLPYPGEYPYRVLFSYPVKSSIQNYDKHR